MFPRLLPALMAGLFVGLAAGQAHAGLFDDEEARKAILDLRQKVEANRQASEVTSQKLAEEVKRASDENVMLRRSLLDLQNQIETLRSELAALRGAGYHEDDLRFICRDNWLRVLGTSWRENDDQAHLNTLSVEPT